MTSMLVMICLLPGAPTLQDPPVKPAVQIPAPTSKPPKQVYDKVRDRTVCHSGEVRFRSGSGFSYLAAYAYRGKEPKQPEEVTINFYARRSSDSTDANKDADVAAWAVVREVVLRWAKDPETFPATYEKISDKDDFSKAMMKVMGGRAFYEHLQISVPVGKFYEMAHAKELMVALGNHTDSLGERVMKPLKQLAESLPDR